jgi:poly-gamma-glutamate synthesis protein (capsule biosynthesis protein)
MKSSVTFVGDIFPADLHITLGYGVATYFHNNSFEAWLDSKEIFPSSEIRFGNLESPLTKSIAAKINQMPFLGSYKFIEYLKYLGINIVSVANNHTMEHGMNIFKETIVLLRENGIKVVGYDNEQGKTNIESFIINGVKYGFCAFSSIKDLKYIKSYSRFDLAKAKDVFTRMELESIDVKIISIHWGDEYISIPSVQQINLAEELKNIGFNVIAGHHPHVIQPIIKCDNCVIIYSLGNFIFDMLWAKNTRCGIVVTIAANNHKEIFIESERKIYIQKNYSPMFYQKDDARNNQENWIELYRQDKYLYAKKYNKTKKYNNLKHRILMKLFLFKNIWRLSPNTIIEIIKRKLWRASIEKPNIIY